MREQKKRGSSSIKSGSIFGGEEEEGRNRETRSEECGKKKSEYVLFWGWDIILERQEK